MTTQIEKVTKSKIEEAWKDSDGYWIELKAGWKSADDPVGVCHTIHEDTRREALDVGCMRCDCVECNAEAKP